MMTFNELFYNVMKYEGYYANVTGDRGGETYMGVARNLHPNWLGWTFIDEYKSKNGSIKHNQKIESHVLTELVKDFYIHTFYHTFRIESIKNGALQHIIFDWCVNSGCWGSRGVQRTLNKFFDAILKTDGIIGNKTISAINNCDPKALFDTIKNARILYYHSIADKGQNHKFLKGWLRRINSIKYVV